MRVPALCKSGLPPIMSEASWIGTRCGTDFASRRCLIMRHCRSGRPNHRTDWYRLCRFPVLIICTLSYGFPPLRHKFFLGRKAYSRVYKCIAGHLSWAPALGRPPRALAPKGKSMARGAIRPRNHLLASLSDKSFALLAPDLERVTLPLRQVLEIPDKPIKHIYFLESGLASVVAEAARHRKIEAGLVGWEGMTGVPVLMGDDRSVHSTFIQMAAVAQRLPAARLRDATEQNPALRTCFLRYAQAFSIQATHTALANGQAKLEERLARWLLMCHDRAEGPTLRVTHEFLGLMLSVRRAGVTVAVNSLKQRGVISTTRGDIHIRDRAALRALANGFYGIPEQEYRRLTGWQSLAEPRN
jgi:CRP-like cAMP-binding protein